MTHTDSRRVAHVLMRQMFTPEHAQESLEWEALVKSVANGRDTLTPAQRQRAIDEAKRVGPRYLGIEPTEELTDSNLAEMLLDGWHEAVAEMGL